MCVKPLQVLPNTKVELASIFCKYVREYLYATQDIASRAAQLTRVKILQAVEWPGLECSALLNEALSTTNSTAYSSLLEQGAL
jgi:hypothetical protein